MQTSLKLKICERLKKTRQILGFPTAKSFALLHGLKISTYSLHEAGTRMMSLDLMEQYCTLLNIPINWLLTGEGPQKKGVLRSAPIIQWNEVASYPKKVDIAAKEWTSSDVDLSVRSFALRVNDDSMEPRYPKGALLIVDLEQCPLVREFALIMTAKGPCFKQIVDVKGKRYGYSFDPAHKPFLITDKMKVLGKIVQAKFLC